MMSVSKAMQTNKKIAILFYFLGGFFVYSFSSVKKKYLKKDKKH